MSVSDPKALLKRLLQEPSEMPWLEFKHNNCDPDKIGECVSACANAAMLAEKERAFIAFGVENKTKRRLGTKVVLNALTKGAESLTNWLSRMIEPRLMMEFLDFEDAGKTFAILVIQPSYDRPVRFSGTEYIRVGENVKKLKDFPEQERALWLATSRHKFESAVALAHQSAEQVLDKLSADSYYELSRDAKTENVVEVVRKFTALGFIKDDMEGGYDITNLGAIVLAKDLTAFPSISAKSVRLIKYVGKTKIKSEKEIEGRRGYAVGFKGLMQFLENSLKTEEKYISGVRKLVPVYPLTAIREFIANALIHQELHDYRRRAGDRDLRRPCRDQQSRQLSDRGRSHY